MKAALILVVFYLAILQVESKTHFKYFGNYTEGNPEEGTHLVYEKRVTSQGDKEYRGAFTLHFPGKYSKLEFIITYVEIIDYGKFMSYSEAMEGGAGFNYFYIVRIGKRNALLDIGIKIYGKFTGKCLKTRTELDYLDYLKTLGYAKTLVKT